MIKIKTGNPVKKDKVCMIGNSICINNTVYINIKKDNKPGFYPIGK